jgi:signal transduction histidine kinase
MKVTQEMIASRKWAAGDEDRDRPDRRLLVGYLHKTGNTLCGIKGYAGLIADRERAGGEAASWARKIIVEVERMEEIYRSVGDLTRGRREPDLGLDLPLLVGDLARRPSLHRPELVLRNGPVPDGELLLPAADLALIMEAVLDNSAESRADGETPVRALIRGETDGRGRVILVCEDDGCGLAPALLAQASLPFVTTKDGHLGVGLTRVETLMDMYGLSWSLASDPGRGTAVRLEVGEVI